MTLVKVTETDALCTTHRFLIPPQISGQLCLKMLESSVCCHQPAVFQPQSIFRALESLSRCVDSTWKCKGLNTLLIKWQTGVPGHPSFQWTALRCIPHGSSQSSTKSFWLPTAVLRSVMFLFLTSLVSASLDSAPSWHQPPNSLHPSLCLILSFEWSQIFGGC